jgi:hypothetical protein
MHAVHYVCKAHLLRGLPCTDAWRNALEMATLGPVGDSYASQRVSLRYRVRCGR